MYNQIKKIFLTIICSVFCICSGQTTIPSIPAIPDCYNDRLLSTGSNINTSETYG